jgi:hypothetical protein
MPSAVWRFRNVGNRKRHIACALGSGEERSREEGGRNDGKKEGGFSTRGDGRTQDIGRKKKKAEKWIQGGGRNVRKKLGKPLSTLKLVFKTILVLF